MESQETKNPEQRIPECIRVYMPTNIFCGYLCEKRLSCDNHREGQEQMIKTMAEKYKVMIVDDTMFARILMRECVNELGFEVIAEVAEGLTAIEKARELRPDIIIMDVLLPDIDGILATQKIKAEIEDVYIIIVTSTYTKEIIESAHLAGARSFLKKPFRDWEVAALFGDIAQFCNK